jgi:hypothetical protein
LAGPVLAQDQAVVESTATAEVTSSDLGVAEPTVLPTNAFGYWFKNLGRTIKTTLTFNAEKKAELQLNIANEKLLEAKKIAQENPDNAKAQAMVEKSLQKYQEMMDKVQARVEAIKEKNSASAEKLLDKITDNQLKQQQVMDKIEEKTAGLTEEQKQKFEAIKEKTLEKFGQFLQRVEKNQEKIKERLEKAAESSASENGTISDQLLNLKVIQKLGDKMEDEEMRQGVREANQAVREKFFEQMKEEGSGSAKEFNSQLDGLSGQDADQLRVINFLKEGLDEQSKVDPNLKALMVPLKKFEQNRLNNLKQLLEETKTPEQQQDLLQPLEDSGDTKSIEVIDRLRQEVKNARAKEALQQVQERKVENLNNRLEKMDNQKNIQELKKEINPAPVMQRVIRQADPELLKKMDRKMAEVKKAEKVEKDKEDSAEPKNEANKNDERPNTQPLKPGLRQGTEGQMPARRGIEQQPNAIPPVAPQNMPKL